MFISYTMSTTTTRFDYTTFFNYYTDSNNVSSGRYPQKLCYYDGHVLRKSYTGNTHITVHGDNYYITVMKQKGDMLCDGIMFSIPTTIPGETCKWDFHYHFGMKTIDTGNINIDKQGQKIIPIDVVYFHRTIQDPLRTKDKIPKNCYFLPDQPLTISPKSQKLTV